MNKEKQKYIDLNRFERIMQQNKCTLMVNKNSFIHYTLT